MRYLLETYNSGGLAEIHIPLAESFCAMARDGMLNMLTVSHETAIPNFHFHLTSAYCILRHIGVDVGAFDYLGRDTFVKL